MEYEIDEVRKISIGGVGQKIHIRGEKRTNPVLLFLHGGPGISNRDSVVNREKDLCDVFTIVAWDQRGTGGSYWGVKKETPLWKKKSCSSGAEAGARNWERISASGILNTSRAM